MMKKLLLLGALLLAGCATTQKNRCTLVLRVDSRDCYYTCLQYAHLSEKSPKVGINNNFLSCLQDVCRGANVCYESNEPSPRVETYK